MNSEVLQKQPQTSGQDMIGSQIKGYVRIDRVIWTKTPMDEVEFFTFGICSVELEDLIEGEIPSEFNKSFFGNSQVTFTISGNIPKLDTSRSYYFEGELTSHPKYGLQYKILQLSKFSNLEDPDEIRRFIEIVTSKDKADLLYDYLDDPLKVLREGDIDALLQIPGIGQRTAEKLLVRYQEDYQEGIVATKLAAYGVTGSNVDKVIDHYRSLDIALEVLSKNPYDLIGVIDGISWKRADAIALNAGIDPCGEIRLKAYTKWYLHECANSAGHTWIPLENLVAAIHSIVRRIDDTELMIMMREWIKEDDTEVQGFLHYDRPTNRIGLSYLYRQEDRIAGHLNRLQHSTAKVYSNEEIEKAIEEAEEEVGFQYTEEQREAIYSCLQNNVTFIVASAGCGKTSIMRPVAKVIRNAGHQIAQCSLSGKAASNLTEVTNEQGVTIHRLLSYNQRDGGFNRNEDSPLHYDAVIVDEISLSGEDIFLSLIRAIPDGCRLICLGDYKQLESIGVGNLIKDIPNSGVIPTKILTKIHRQAAASGIISESLRISAGQHIVNQYATVEKRGVLQDLKVNTYTESALSHDKLLEEFDDLYFNRHIPIKDIAIVVAMRDKGDLSCLTINRAIQERVNPYDTADDIVVSHEDGKSYTLRQGDKVLIVQNCYDAKKRMLPQDTKDGKVRWVNEAIYNGNVGFYKRKDFYVDNDNVVEAMVVDLTMQGEVYIPLTNRSTVELGYAMTCHKIQGTGVPYVIVGLDMRAYALLSREWVYTALTRAKKECVLVAQIGAVRKATEISRVSVKHTWLQELLIQKEEEFKRTGQVPVIAPDPVVKMLAERRARRSKDEEENDDSE